MSRPRRSLALFGVIAPLLGGCSSDGEPARDIVIDSTAAPQPQVARAAGEPTPGRTAGEPESIETPIVVHALGAFDVLPGSAADWPDSLPAVGDDLATMGAIACPIGSDGCSIEDIVPLAQGDMDVVSLASTETGGDADLLLPLATELRDLDITVVGFGESQATAVDPVLLQLDGFTVAFYGISLVESEDFPFAGEDTAGIAGPDALDLLTERLESSAANADAVIVSVQWGEADSRAPTDEMANTAALLVDAGATAIVGHGSSFLQRLEVVEGAPVVYNLGNGATQSEEPLQRDTAVLRLNFGGLGAEPTCLLPATSDLNGPVLDDLDLRDCRDPAPSSS